MTPRPSVSWPGCAGAPAVRCLLARSAEARPRDCRPWPPTRSAAPAGVLSQHRTAATGRVPLIPGMPGPSTKASRKGSRKGLPVAAKAVPVLPAVTKAVSDAAADGRLLALRVLEDINWSSDPRAWIPHAVTCLEIYRQSIENLYAAEARAALKADKAADIVERWYTQPSVRKEIELSRRNRHVIYSHLTFIMVGAGHEPTLRDWLLHAPESFEEELKTAKVTRDFRPLYSRYYYKGQLAAAVFKELLRWAPDGRADDAYKFYVWLSRGRAGEGAITTDASLQTFPIVKTTMAASGCIHAGRTATPRIYERFAAAVIRDRMSYTKASTTCGPEITEAVVSMWHPTNPDWKPGVWLLQCIQKDPRHVLRFLYATYPTKTSASRGQDFYRLFTERIAMLLVADGEPVLAEEMQRFFKETWGDGSPFMTGKPRPSEPNLPPWRSLELLRFFPSATPRKESKILLHPASLVRYVLYPPVEANDAAFIDPTKGWDTTTEIPLRRPNPQLHLSVHA